MTPASGGPFSARPNPSAAFAQDLVPGVNETIFEAHGTDDKIAEFLADAVVVCLNSDPHHLISNFPPTIETIQDEVLHALRSYGFQNTADAYECYRWGRHWLREGAITADKFVGNGFPRGADGADAGLEPAARLRHRRRAERDCPQREDQAAGGRIARPLRAVAR